MPTYAYTCNDCDHQFETVQSITEDPLSVCPACNGTIRRLINSAGIMFKGSGFYVNDSKGTKE